jgi:hypothetical protein
MQRQGLGEGRIYEEVLFCAILRVDSVGYGVWVIENLNDDTVDPIYSEQKVFTKVEYSL